MMPTSLFITSSLITLSFPKFRYESCMVVLSTSILNEVRIDIKGQEVESKIIFLILENFEFCIPSLNDNG